MSNPIVLAENADANGTYPASGVAVPAGRYQVFVEGTFQSGVTATLQGGTSFANSVAYSDGEFSAPNIEYVCEVGNNAVMSAVIAGVSSPAPDITITLMPTGE